jgi:hypothetical protein
MMSRLACATQEIARNAGAAAKDTRDVSENVTEVQQRRKNPVTSPPPF